MPDEKDDAPWTKKELSIRVGWGELAQAVVEQWKKDGPPFSIIPTGTLCLLITCLF